MLTSWVPEAPWATAWAKGMADAKFWKEELEDRVSAIQMKFQNFGKHLGGDAEIAHSGYDHVATSSVDALHVPPGGIQGFGARFPPLGKAPPPKQPRQEDYAANPPGRRTTWRTASSPQTACGGHCSTVSRRGHAPPTHARRERHISATNAWETTITPSREDHAPRHNTNATKVKAWEQLASGEKAGNLIEVRPTSRTVAA